jgi:hypothetical protein
MPAPATIAAPPAGYATPTVNGGVVGVTDPEQAAINVLPERAQERLLALTAEQGRDRTAANAALEFQNECLEDLKWARSNFEQDKRQHVGLHINMAQDRAAEHEGRIARNKSTHEAAVKASGEASRKSNSSREVLNLVRGYVTYVAGRTWQMEPETHRQFTVRNFPNLTVCEVDAALPPGKTRVDMIAAEHERQSALRGEARRVKLARGGVVEDLAAFESDLDKRADEEPFKVTFNGSSFVARFPIIGVAAESRGGEVPHAPDYLPAYIKAHKKAIMAEARKVIENHYVDGDMLVLTAEEKRARLRDIAKELLASDRIIAEHIWRSRDEGFFIAFDPGMSPLSILGVEGPPPPRPRR